MKLNKMMEAIIANVTPIGKDLSCISNKSPERVK